jgi:hypothetical protein
MSPLIILTKTPPWVFLVLAYLVWQGLQSLKARTQPLLRILVVPGLFIAFGVSRILGGAGAHLDALIPWLVGFVILAPIALFTGPRLIAVDRDAGLVTRPGSVIPLIRNLTTFSLQYAVAIMIGVHAGGSSTAAMIAHGISGATAGYFAGWVAVAVRHYQRAPSGTASLLGAHRSSGQPNQADRERGFSGDTDHAPS